MRSTRHWRLLMAALVLVLVLQPLAAFAAPRSGVAPAAVGPLAADDDPSTAPVLGPSPVVGTLNEVTDYEDYFKINLSAGQKITLSLTGPAGTDFGVDLIAPGLEEYVAFADEGAYPRATSYVVPTGEGGTYYLDVYAWTGAGTYTLTYTVGAADPDDIYPGGAIPVSPVSGSLGATDDIDYYSVALTAGQKLSFEITGDAGTDFAAHLLGPGGTEDYRSGAYGEAYPYYGNYVVRAGKGGTYSLAVERFDGAGDYALSYTISTADADDQWPGTPLTPSPINGALDYRTDTDDLFYVDLAQGERITATLTGPVGSDFGLILFGPSFTDLYDSEGVEFAYDGAYPRQLVYSAPTAGRYYLDVSGWDDTGSYTLTWEIGSTPPKTYVPIAGDNRYDTAIAASKQAFPGKAPTVVIATGENWPDALGGAALAAAKGGPILLTNTASLTPAVKWEILRLGATEAFVLGGTKAVSVTTFNQIKALVPNTTRLSGDNRYQTAEAIARKVVAIKGASFDGSCFVTTGVNFPDALGASPLSAAGAMPILLSPPTGMTSGTLNTISALKIDSAVVLGGEKALPSSALEGLQDREVYTQRISGGTRYETAAKVAAFGKENLGLSYDKVVIATGANFPDALAAGAMQAVDGSLMLLTPTSNTLDPYVKGALTANKWNIDTVRFMGGVKALTSAVRDQVKQALFIATP